MSALQGDGGPEITSDYVEQMLETVARRTGFRLAHDRFGFVPAVLEADRANVAAARPAPAGEAVEVERLTKDRDECFRRHAITEREACDAAARIGELVREIERAKMQLVTTRTQRDTAQLRATRACERATAAEAALAQARAVLRQVEHQSSACQICDADLDHEERHTPGCALAAEIGPRPDADQSESFQPEMTLSESPISGVAELAPARVQVRNPINGDHHVLDTNTARTVETRRDGPAPGVPVLPLPVEGDRHG